MRSIVTCVANAHDHRLIALAALVCTIGVYATFAIGAHAYRETGRERRSWSITGVVAAGSTAWATHFIALLAFRPGMEAGFEPVLTAVSLLTAIVIIGSGLILAVNTRRPTVRFAAGVILGSGVGALHYLGQAAYVVVGTVTWDWTLVATSLVASIVLAGIATVVASSRNRTRRAAAVPVFLMSIAVLHFSGMTAATFTFDPRRSLPPDAVAPEAIAPVVAGVCVFLLALAALGLRFSLQAKARFRRDRLRLRELADVALEGLLICSGDSIVTANTSIETLSGYDQGALASRCASSLLPRCDLPNLPELEERETELVGADGQIVPVRVLRRPVTLGAKVQNVYAIRDQRERLRTEAQVRTLTFTDALTGLPNRARFFDDLALHAASRRASDEAFAVLIIDVDRFKSVNDAFGHAAGDLLLRKVADRLRSTVRGKDILARLGGDEFAVLQTDVLKAANDSIALATRIIESLSRPFLLDGNVVHLGASVGLAFAPSDATDPAELLHCADLALFAAKSGGKGAFRVFEVEMDARMQERRDLEAGLRRALAFGEFEVHYQPLQESCSGRISSAEALVRWRHPERGMIPPSHFVGLAEETGLIVPLGEWVLYKACAEAAAWPSNLSVAVNLSPAQFRDPRLADTVGSALAAAKLSPRRLELEITESVLLTDEEQTLTTLSKLRAQGVRISMDDFGTGYASLSNLRRFAFDKIKVDQSFIQQLPGDPDSAAIVRAIINMAVCLGISTTVEGVETQEQFAFTTAEGCDHVQGYLISRPLPAEDFKVFLEEREKAFEHDMQRFGLHDINQLAAFS